MEVTDLNSRYHGKEQLTMHFLRIHGRNGLQVTQGTIFCLLITKMLLTAVF
jgi:hypothetical protein